MNWNDIKQQSRWLVGITVVLFAVEAINLLTGRSLAAYGVFPRELHYLPMIISSPFIHANPAHLLANWFTLIVFIALMGLQGQRRFIGISIWIIVLTGVCVWLFGRSAIHLGASGLIYGYFGFLILAGWRSRRKRMLLVSVLVALAYGTMVIGVLPVAGFVSWESHLFGFISVLIAAWYLAH